MKEGERDGERETLSERERERPRRRERWREREISGGKGGRVVRVPGNDLGGASVQALCDALQARALPPEHPGPSFWV